MQQISGHQLKSWLDDPHRAPPLLLDVRENWEFQVCRIEGAQLIPMGQIPALMAELDCERETVVVCHHGVRSFSVCRYLESHGFSRLSNLSGGLAAWAREVDTQMPTY